MDGRLSDFEDVFILFMKRQKESFSRSGSRSGLNKYKYSQDFFYHASFGQDERGLIVSTL